MKCPKCDGSGDIPRPNGTKLFGLTEVMTCDLCNGTGEVEMTNEEWLHTLNTEQLAKFIFWQHFDVYGKTLYELMVNASRGVSRDRQAEVVIGAVVEWLKQPHTKE